MTVNERGNPIVGTAGKETTNYASSA